MRLRMLRKMFIPALLVLLAASLPAQDKGEKKSKDTSSSIDTTKISWVSYDQGLKLAKSSGKHIMAYFTTKWCGYCKKMQKEAFVDPEVIKYLNSHFISIWIDAESNKELDIDGYKITEQKLSQAEYRVGGYPTFWFLKPNTDRIAPAPGYKSTEQFLDILYFVKDDLYEKMSFADYIKNGGRNKKN